MRAGCTDQVACGLGKWPCVQPVSAQSCFCRWTVGDASIFSVDDGKRLAQTPHKPLTFYERVRLEKQHKASIETPLVQGYRLLPEFTPGRAMFWGTILAVWGTAAVVMSTAKSLDIHTVSLKSTAQPPASASKQTTVLHYINEAYDSHMLLLLRMSLYLLLLDWLLTSE